MIEIDHHIPDKLLRQYNRVYELTADAVSFLTKKMSNIRLMTIGFIIITVGFSWLTLFKDGMDYCQNVAVPMILIGIGQGFVPSPVTDLAVEDTPKDLSGVSSSLINVMLQIGGAFVWQFFRISPKLTFQKYRLSIIKPWVSHYFQW